LSGAVAGRRRKADAAMISTARRKAKAPVSEGLQRTARGEDLSGFPHRRDPHAAPVVAASDVVEGFRVSRQVRRVLRLRIAYQRGIELLRGAVDVHQFDFVALGYCADEAVDLGRREHVVPPYLGTLTCRIIRLAHPKIKGI